GRRICISARSLRPALELSVWLDPDVGSEKRFDRDAGYGILPLSFKFPSRAEEAAGAYPDTARRERRTARGKLGPTAGHGPHHGARDTELFRSESRRECAGAGYGL